MEKLMVEYPVRGGYTVVPLDDVKRVHRSTTSRWWDGLECPPCYYISSADELNVYYKYYKHAKGTAASGKTREKWNELGREAVGGADYTITVNGDRLAFWYRASTRPKFT